MIGLPPNLPILPIDSTRQYRYTQLPPEQLQLSSVRRTSTSPYLTSPSSGLTNPPERSTFFGPQQGIRSINSHYSHSRSPKLEMENARGTSRIISPEFCGDLMDVDTHQDPLRTHGAAIQVYPPERCTGCRFATEEGRLDGGYNPNIPQDVHVLGVRLENTRIYVDDLSASRASLVRPLSTWEVTIPRSLAIRRK